MRSKYLFLISSFIFLSAVLSGQTPPNYYVSDASGNDITGDGTLANPWQTIEHAFATIPPVTSESLTLHILAGNYAIANTLFVGASRGGSNENYFTIKSYMNDVVTIDGGNIVTYDAMLLIASANFVKVEGIKFNNLIGNEKSGVFISGNSKFVEISNNEFSNIHWTDTGQDPTPNDNAHPLYIIGTSTGDSIANILISNNEFFDISPGYSEVLTVTGYVDSFTIDGNIIHDVNNIGIVVAGNYQWVEDNHGITPAENQARNGTVKNNEVYLCGPPCGTCDHPAGIYLDGSKNIIVENNISHDNDGFGFSIGCESEGSSTGHILRNNVAYNNQFEGLIVGSNAEIRNVQNIKIFGNTLFRNASKIGEYGGELTFQVAKDVEIKNNIMVAHDSVLIVVNNLCTSSICTGLEMDYNLYFADDISNVWFDWDAITNSGYAFTTFNDYQTYQMSLNPQQAIHSGFQDPLFMDGTLPDPDLHLMSGSPAIDNGDPSYVMASGEVDMDLEDRIYNGIRIDQGADETSESPLPVEYLNVLQAIVVEQGIRLKWSTASEINAGRFILERVSSNQRWEIIHEVPAYGDAHHYQIIDQHPRMGNNYYRLKLIDLGGHYEYSPAVVAEWRNEERPPVLFPNPAKGTINIEKGSSDISAIKIYTALGKEIRNYSGTISRIDDLPGGLYFGAFVTAGKTFVVPFRIIE